MVSIPSPTRAFAPLRSRLPNFLAYYLSSSAPYLSVYGELRIKPNIPFLSQQLPKVNLPLTLAEYASDCFPTLTSLSVSRALKDNRQNAASKEADSRSCRPHR